MISLLKKLTAAFGVSGNEEHIRKVIADEIKEYVDEIKVDTLGNLIAVKKGTGKSIMLTSHMDETGIMAMDIDDNGFISFSTIGDISHYLLTGRKIKFQNGLIGIIFYEQKENSLKDLKISDLYIDIGARNRKEAQQLVDIGDAACLLDEIIIQGDNIISGRLDNRAGCAVLIKTIQSKPQTDNELIYLFTVQSLLGQRGAKTASFSINPDIAISIDAALADDTPQGIKQGLKLGEGPGIKIKDKSIICHPEVNKLLSETAEKQNIDIQLEIGDTENSDLGTIYVSKRGILCGGVSIPCRYLHSPVEMINLKDMENTVTILKNVVI